MHDGFACGKNAFGFTVSLCLGKVSNQVFTHFIGSIKAEWGGITDVEFDDVVALSLHPHRFRQNGAANVVTNIVQLVRFADFAHGFSENDEKTWTALEAGNIRFRIIFGNVARNRENGQ